MAGGTFIRITVDCRSRAQLRFFRCQSSPQKPPPQRAMGRLRNGDFSSGQRLPCSGTAINAVSNLRPHPPVPPVAPFASRPWFSGYFPFTVMLSPLDVIGVALLALVWDLSSATEPFNHNLVLVHIRHSHVSTPTCSHRATFTPLPLTAPLDLRRTYT